jgi:hypothetical protein
MSAPIERRRGSGLRGPILLASALLLVNLGVLGALHLAPLPPAHLPLQVQGAIDRRQALPRAAPAALTAPLADERAAITALDAIFEARLRAAGGPEVALPDPALRAAARASTAADSPAVDALLRDYAARMAALGEPLRPARPPHQ